MAKKQELEITIDDDGNISSKAIGAEGKECLEWTAAIEGALGQVEERKKTGDFYVEPVKTDTHLDQKGGSGS